MTTFAERLSAVVIRPDATALERVPGRQARWVAAQAVVAGVLWLTGLWSSHPELSLSLALSIGPIAAIPRRIWALPLVSAGVVAAGLGVAALGAPAILGAGAAAGLALALLLPEETDALDWINATLATFAGAALGLFAAVNLTGALEGTLLGTVLLASLVGLVASQGLLPVAIRPQVRGLPTRSQVQRTLREPYRPPVFRGLDLFTRARPHAPDRRTRAGLAEVAGWIYKLQLTLQSHDDALDTIDPEAVGERIARCLDPDESDSFTRERQQATATHLQRLLDHREALAQERRRTEALVDYALAFLEEASAGLALARQLPGESSPDRLPEVLHRLRDHAEAGDARRQTSRELAHLQV